MNGFVAFYIRRKFFLLPRKNHFSPNQIALKTFYCRCNFDCMSVFLIKNNDNIKKACDTRLHSPIKQDKAMLIN